MNKENLKLHEVWESQNTGIRNFIKKTTDVKRKFYKAGKPLIRPATSLL